MQVIKSVRLLNTEGSSDKEYRLQLVKEGDYYNVYYQNGRRGGNLQNGLKTSAPVNEKDAHKVFDATLRSKTKSGYILDEESNKITPSAISVVKEKDNTNFTVQLLKDANTQEELSNLLNDDNYFVQEKYDGERRTFDKSKNGCFAGNKKNEKVVLNPLIESSAIEHADLLIDGEEVGDIFYAFDILRINGKCLKSNKASKRIELLSSLSFGDNIIVAEAVFSKEDKVAFLEQKRLDLAEGIVFKEANSPYSGGRDKSTAFKHKFYKTATVKVSFITKGKRSVQMSVKEDDNFTNVGSVTIPPNKDIPSEGDYIEVRYLYAYKGGALFQPVFLFKRTDADDSDSGINQLQYKQGRGE